MHMGIIFVKNYDGYKLICFFSRRPLFQCFIQKGLIPGKGTFSLKSHSLNLKIHVKHFKKKTFNVRNFDLSFFIPIYQYITYYLNHLKMRETIISVLNN